jgi:hypothetical protein
MHHLRKKSMYRSFDFRYGEHDAERIFQYFFDTLLGELAKNALNQLFVRFFIALYFSSTIFLCPCFL